MDDGNGNHLVCEGELPRDGYGQAITSCAEMPDGALWVGNDEYASQVAFCPYCGFKAKVQPKSGKETP